MVSTLAKKKILILDGQEAPYSLFVVRSLASAGCKVDLGFAVGARDFDSHSRFVTKSLFYPDPIFDQQSFVSFLKETGSQYDFIIPLFEKTQLVTSTVKKELESCGSVVPIPDSRTLEEAVDKVIMLRAAEGLGIKVPPTIIRNERMELDSIISELGLPFIIKASGEMNVLPGEGERYFVVRERISQKSFDSMQRALLKHGPIVTQAYISGAGVGCSFLFSRNHKLVAYFGHRRILEEYQNGGPSVIAQTELNKEAFDYGYRLLDRLKWKGVAMTEFKMDKNGDLYFMEVNPRFWGTLPLAIASSVDFPRLLVEKFDQEATSAPFFPSRQRVFISVSTFASVLVESLRAKNSVFVKQILRSIILSLSAGTPSVVELQFWDIKPITSMILSRLRSNLTRYKEARVSQNLSFGPALSYTHLSHEGVLHIVDLREDYEKNHVEIPSSMQYHNFSIADDSALEVRELSSIVKTLDTFVKDGLTYVHCRLGRGRSSMVMVSYLIYKGMPLQQAFSFLYHIRPFAYLNPIQMRAIYNFHKDLIDTNASHTKLADVKML